MLQATYRVHEQCKRDITRSLLLKSSLESPRCWSDFGESGIPCRRGAVLNAEVLEKPQLQLPVEVGTRLVIAVRLEPDSTVLRR